MVLQSYPSKNIPDFLLGPCKLSLRIVDENGTIVKETEESEYRDDGTLVWQLFPLEIDLSDLTPGKTYRCIPILRYHDWWKLRATPSYEFTILRYHDWWKLRATPSYEFTMPQDLSASPSNLSIPVGNSAVTQIIGGWDTFAAVIEEGEEFASIVHDDSDPRKLKIFGKKQGTAKLKIEDRRSKQVAYVSITIGDESEHEYVDLGLPSGTLWATCNVGANSPEEYGDYFAWGETESKELYEWTTYKWCNGSYRTITKYCIDSNFGYNGFTDNKMELDTEDDAATANWGKDWQMPSIDQIKELINSEYTTKEETQLHGVLGTLVTGPNGNTIFLPSAGSRSDNLYNAGDWGSYWSRSLSPKSEVNDNDAWALDVGFYCSLTGWNPCGGRSVRPVRVNNNKDNVSTQTFTVNGVSFKMIGVEGGTFRMGEGASLSDEEYRYDQRPIHDVTISDFMIGETEVTQKLWKAVMGNNPSYNQNDECPVEEINWNLCQLFIAKLNKITGKKFRLPTEAEWEFAARGGNYSHGYQFAGSDNAGDVAWYYYYSGYKTMPVALKQPNELGLYDMSGNVRDWCYDWYGKYEWGACTNPCYREEGNERVVRGGNCTDTYELCVFYRGSEHPFIKSNGVGFRLAMGDAILPHLLLSNTSLTLNTGQNYNIEIISGSGNYSISNSNNSIASGFIENNIIKVTAVGEGVSYISIIDQETKEKLDIHLTITQETPIYTKTYTANGVPFNMVFVKGSSFWMGAQEDETDPYDFDELPCHPVRLNSFYIGQTEVTQGLWEAVMGNNPSYNQNDECPVDCVSWEDCQEFIAKLNDITGCTFRLPTEAEWEYAARGGLNSHGYKYAGSDDLDEVAWHNRRYSDNPEIVAQKKANELGLFDMSGNVAEWCADTYNSEYYSSSPIDNPCNVGDGDDKHVLRGGGQYLFSYSGSYRVTYRDSFYRGSNDTGLRLVLSDHGGGVDDGQTGGNDPDDNYDGNF